MSRPYYVTVHAPDGILPAVRECALDGPSAVGDEIDLLDRQEGLVDRVVTVRIVRRRWVHRRLDTFSEQVWTEEIPADGRVPELQRLREAVANAGMHEIPIDRGGPTRDECPFCGATKTILDLRDHMHGCIYVETRRTHFRDQRR